MGGVPLGKTMPLGLLVVPLGTFKVPGVVGVVPVLEPGEVGDPLGVLIVPGVPLISLDSVPPEGLGTALGVVLVPGVTLVPAGRLFVLLVVVPVLPVLLVVPVGLTVPPGTVSVLPPGVVIVVELLPLPLPGRIMVLPEFPVPAGVVGVPSKLVGVWEIAGSPIKELKPATPTTPVSNFNNLLRLTSLLNMISLSDKLFFESVTFFTSSMLKLPPIISTYL